MALSDTHIDTCEIELMRSIVTQKGLSEADISEVLLHPERMDSAMPQSIEDKIECLYHLGIVLWADGIVADAEVSTLRAYIIKYGFDAENAAEIAQFIIDATKNGEETSLAEVLNIVKQSM
jgi:hypothetical protein